MLGEGILEFEIYIIGLSTFLLVIDIGSLTKKQEAS